MLNAKFPFMVEFTGSPEAGKTTCIKTILERFSKIGLKVKYVQESAEIIGSETNIPKKSFESHLSMRLLTVFNILKAKYEDYDLILIDRGLIDGIFYTTKFLADNPNNYEESNKLINFLDVLKITIAPDFLIIFKVNPETAIERRGGEGSIVNHTFIESYNHLLDAFYATLSCPNLLIDTTLLSKEEVSDIVFDLIFDKMEHPLN